MAIFELVIGKELVNGEATDAIKSALGGLEFPLTLTVENLMPRPFADPRLLFFLDSNQKHNGKHFQRVEFPHLKYVIRLADDMETIAKLNGYKKAFIIRLEGETSSEAHIEEEYATETTQEEEHSEGVQETTPPSPKKGRKNTQKEVNNGE